MTVVRGFSSSDARSKTTQDAEIQPSATGVMCNTNMVLKAAAMPAKLRARLAVRGHGAVCNP